MSCVGVLGYTNDDDGVWLTCDWRLPKAERCDFGKKLGHDPQVDDVVQAEREHMEYAQKRVTL